MEDLMALVIGQLKKYKIRLEQYIFFCKQKKLVLVIYLIMILFIKYTFLEIVSGIKKYLRKKR